MTWLPVVGLEDRYEVSDLGVVRNAQTGRELRPNSWCRGYQRVRMWDGDRQVGKAIHHLVLEAFVGPRPEGHLGLHRDDDSLNNAVSNLRWGTVSENGLDAVRNGVHPEAKKTRCPQGHEYTPENIKWSMKSNGSRSRKCRTCDNERKRVNR